MALDEASSESPQALDEALADVATALRSDGFTTEWAADQEGRVSFVVGAGDADCADCLVPKPVLEAMLSQALDGSGFTLSRVQMPEELHAVD